MKRASESRLRAATELGLRYRRALVSGLSWYRLVSLLRLALRVRLPPASRRRSRAEPAPTLRHAFVGRRRSVVTDAPLDGAFEAYGESGAGRERPARPAGHA